MTVKIGSDIVYLPKFERTLRKSRDYFEQKVFWPAEMEYARVQRLASIFAAKEATIKALGLKAGQWRDIRVAYEESGKPYLAKFPASPAGRPQDKKSRSKWKHELTIAHDGDYALANVVFYK